MTIAIEPRTPSAFAERLDAAATAWQRRFVEIARFAPPHAPIADVLAAFVEHHQIGRPDLRIARLPELDRALAERTLTVLLRFELAYRQPRLDEAAAGRAAAEFFAPFGPATRWFSTIDVNPELLEAKECGGACSFTVNGWLFGTTLEEGLIAYDPEGMIGAVFVGDED